MSIPNSLKSLAKRPKCRVFRRLEIKRRETSGEFETNWQTIPEKLIKSYGSVSYGVSDVRVNFYKYSGMDFAVRNENGYFNDVEDPDSFFFGKLTTYRSLVRVSAGYYDDTDAEVPTNTVVYTGIIDEGFNYSDDNIVTIKTAHISQVFAEFAADRVPSLSGTLTASDMIEKIRDTVDTNNVAIFQKYISLTAWNIETTTNYYTPNTLTSLQDRSTWDIIKLIAEGDNKLVYIDQVGNFNFESVVVGSDSVYHFSGFNDEDNSCGKNIIGPIKYNANIKDVYNRIKIRHSIDETSTSYYYKRENWVWGDSSSSFKYGQRTYSTENYMLDGNSAADVADTIFTRYSEPRKTFTFKAKFLPGLEINDRVNLTHLSGEVKENAYYGIGNYDSGIYSKYKMGSINELDVDLIVKNISYNIDDFTMMLVLEEIVE